MPSSYFDTYKQEKILINSDEEHNKFWAARLDDKTNTVHIRWGRLGTKGQSQTKEFGVGGSSYRAINFMDSKFNEKRRKGYAVVTSDEFNRKATEAAIIGSSNKCHAMNWKRINKVDSHVAGGYTLAYDDIKIEELYDSNCVPGLLVALETRKEDKISILLTVDRTYRLTGGSVGAFGTGGFKGTSHLATGVEVKKGDDIYELVEKIQEAIGRSM